MLHRGRAVCAPMARRIVGEGVDAQVGSETVPVGHCEGEDPLATTGGENGEGRGDGRLPNATLA